MSHVPGLTVIEQWIDPELEAALLAAIDSSPWRADLKRRVQHYGWQYDYKARRVTPSMRLGPLPPWASALARRIARERLCEREPDQVIVNEYAPGQGISRHIDCVPCFGPTILSLSLCSSCLMEFTCSKHLPARVVLLPRSLLVLTGDARRVWAHAIPGRKTDVIDGIHASRARRVSLTFRTVLSEIP